MKHVTLVVRRIDPLKSNTVIASHTVFCFTPSCNPSRGGVVKQAIMRATTRKGT
jgi:hypothetical protein